MSLAGKENMASAKAITAPREKEERKRRIATFFNANVLRIKEEKKKLRVPCNPAAVRGGKREEKERKGGTPVAASHSFSISRSRREGKLLHDPGFDAEGKRRKGSGAPHLFLSTSDGKKGRRT